MTDPLDALRTPVVPVDPDPRFAARLRDRLRRALLAPSDIAGGTVSTTGTTDTRPRLRQGDITYASLQVPDVERATAFYGRVLGWRYLPNPDPARSHRVEGSRPTQGVWGPAEPPTLFLCYAVENVAAAVERVWDAGGRAAEPVREPFGLVADCTDDQGMRFAVWELEGAAEAAPTSAARPGDLAYVTMRVPDSARTRAFYGAVLGWEFRPGRIEDGWEALSPTGGEVSPMVGLWGGGDQPPAAWPMYLVEDIDAAVAEVRAAGGTSTDPEKQSYGISAECVDDQGTSFYLAQW